LGYFIALKKFFTLWFEVPFSHITILSLIIVSIAEIAFPVIFTFLVTFGLLDSISFLKLPIYYALSPIGYIYSVSPIPVPSSNSMQSILHRSKCLSSSQGSSARPSYVTTTDVSRRGFAQVRKMCDFSGSTRRSGIIRSKPFATSIAMRDWLCAEEGMTDAVKHIATVRELQTVYPFDNLECMSKALLAVNKIGYLGRVPNDALRSAMLDLPWKYEQIKVFKKYNPAIDWEDLNMFESMFHDFLSVLETYEKTDSATKFLTDIFSVAKEYSGDMDIYKFFDRLDRAVNIQFVQTRVARSFGSVNNSFCSTPFRGLESDLMCDLSDFQMHVQYWFEMGAFKNLPTKTDVPVTWDWDAPLDPVILARIRKPGLSDGFTILLNGFIMLVEIKTHAKLGSSGYPASFGFHGPWGFRLKEFFATLFAMPNILPADMERIAERFSMICKKHNISHYALLSANTNVLLHKSGSSTIELPDWSIHAENSMAVLCEITQRDLVREQLLALKKFALAEKKGFDPEVVPKLEIIERNTQIFTNTTKKALGGDGIQFPHFVVIGKAQGEDILRLEN
jgi:hypothetical protein